METITAPSDNRRRTPDLDYYTARARKLRARYIRHGLRRIAIAVMRRARDVGRWFDERAHRRAALRELATLDARALADIGITRGDINAIASGAFNRDGTRQHRRPPINTAVGTTPNNVAWLNRSQPGIRHTGTDCDNATARCA